MEVPLRTECCFAPINGEHFSYCSAGADVDKVNASLKCDVERYTESYISMNTENVRKRVLAVTNGFHKPLAPPLNPSN